MNWFQRSLRRRIFFTMIALILGASILIAGVTIYQYKQEAQQLRSEKLIRKENAIRDHISYILKKTTYEVKTENIPLIFKDEIYKIRNIHDVDLSLYSLEGELLRSSLISFYKDSSDTSLQPSLLNKLKNVKYKRLVKSFKKDGESYRSSYTYIADQYFKPIAVLNLPLVKDTGFIERKLNEFLQLLAEAYLLMLLIASVLAYFLTRSITGPLASISRRIDETRLEKRNERIDENNASVEIKPIIHAYNKMIDQLEESAAKLARSEREEAWREMARQVAHEIKNPLTPMRLSVQSLERNFDPNDPNAKDKLRDYARSLINQIDTLSSIAGAFSDFAKMPVQKNEELHLASTVKLAIDIFNDDNLYFKTDQEDLKIKFDRTQLIRVVTNLVKNAQQACHNLTAPEIYVAIRSTENHIFLSVEDNGKGIAKEDQKRIFEPKFSTKSRGMGLGLGMVKNIVENYGGNISFESELNKGTKFIITLPKN